MAPRLMGIVTALVLAAGSGFAVYLIGDAIHASADATPSVPTPAQAPPAVAVGTFTGAHVDGLPVYRLPHVHVIARRPPG